MISNMKVLLDSDHDDKRFQILVNPVDEDRLGIRIAEIDGLWVMIIGQGLYEDLHEFDAHAKFLRIARILLTEHMNLLE
jgi:hypothetical protein